MTANNPTQRAHHLLLRCMGLLFLTLLTLGCAGPKPYRETTTVLASGDTTIVRLKKSDDPYLPGDELICPYWAAGEYCGSTAYWEWYGERERRRRNNVGYGGSFSYLPPNVPPTSVNRRP